MPKIADAYLDDGRVNVGIRSTPGRTVNFHGNHAEIHHENDLPAVLALSRVIVAFDRDHMDWVPGWLAGAGQVSAVVQLPEGYALGPAPEYRLTATANKRKKGWKHGEDGPGADTGAVQEAG